LEALDKINTADHNKVVTQLDADIEAIMRLDDSLLDSIRDGVDAELQVINRELGHADEHDIGWLLRAIGGVEPLTPAQKQQVDDLIAAIRDLRAEAFEIVEPERPRLRERGLRIFTMSMIAGAFGYGLSLTPASAAPGYTFDPYRMASPPSPFQIGLDLWQQARDAYNRFII